MEWVDSNLKTIIKYYILIKNISEREKKEYYNHSILETTKSNKFLEHFYHKEVVDINVN